MALITDPDDLNQGTEVTINTGAKTITLNQAGNLSTDGVTLQALFSFLKEEWLNDAALPAYPFPMTPITNESFELIEGWDFADDASRYLVRTGGWTVRNTGGNVTQKWAGIVGLGSIEANDQIYFDQGAGATDMQLQGQVNQAVKVLDDPNGDGNFVDGFDFRGVFDLFVREQGQAFGRSSLGDIGVTQMDSIAYRFPLSTATDLKITTADTGIDANTDGTADVAPFDNMSITYIGHQNQGTWAVTTVYAANDVVQSGTDGRWYITAAGGTSAGDDTNLAGGSDTGVTWTAFTGERQIGSTWYAFGVVIDGNNATAEQIYEFAQWSLRQSVDIDAGAGSVIGETADELLEFVGDTLKTKRQTDTNGVYIDNFNSNDINRIAFVDDTGAERTYPFTASITIQFNDNLQNDAAAKYWVYFTDPDETPDGDEWGTAGALLVDDDVGADMTGTISAQSSVSHTFAYDSNTQGGRTAGTDADVTVIAIGTDTAQYVRATGTIARSTSNVVALTAALERSYANAA